jgi:hypothetical protein
VPAFSPIHAQLTLRNYSGIYRSISPRNNVMPSPRLLSIHYLHAIANVSSTVLPLANSFLHALIITVIVVL